MKQQISKSQAQETYVLKSNQETTKKKMVTC